MKPPRMSLCWVDGAGVLVLALMTAGLHFALIGPTLDLRAREDGLRARLTSMGSNLAALRTRNREFEDRVAEARRIVEAQPPLERSDALLTRRAAVTSLLADHGLLLDEFKTASAPSAGRRDQAPDKAPPADSEGFVRHRLELRGEGAFPDIVAMMSALRARFSDTLIEGVEISGHPFGSSDQRQFTLKLVWYASTEGGA
jgi:hypothetical protein